MQLAAFCCSFVCCLLDWLLGCCSVLRWAVPCLALLAARPTHSHYNLETLMKLALLFCFMTSFRSPLFVCCWLADFACSLFVLIFCWLLIYFSFVLRIRNPSVLLRLLRVPKYYVFLRVHPIPVNLSRLRRTAHRAEVVCVFGRLLVCVVAYLSFCQSRKLDTASRRGCLPTCFCSRTSPGCTGLLQRATASLTTARLMCYAMHQASCR